MSLDISVLSSCVQSFMEFDEINIIAKIKVLTNGRMCTTGTVTSSWDKTFLVTSVIFVVFLNL